MAQFDKDEDEENQTPEAADAAMAAAGQEDDDNADLSELSKEDAASGPPDVRSYIAQKYGLGSTAGTYDKMAGDSMANVKAARQQAKDSNYTADMGQSLASIFKGRGKVDPSVYNNIRAQGAQGAQQASQDRADLLKNYLTANNLGRQDVTDDRASKDFDFKQGQQQRLTDEQGLEDAVDSPQSAMARDLLKQMGYTGDTKDMTATKFKTLGPMYEKLFQAKENAEARKLGFQQTALYRQSLEDDKRRKEATGDLSALGKDLDGMTASSRTQMGVAQGKVNTADRIFSLADVTPEEVAASQKDPKAKAALIAKLDAMQPQKRSEVVSGLMNMVNGSNGGSLGQFEELKGNTLNDALGNMKQWATSDPQAGNSGGMALSTLQSIMNERTTGQKALDDHSARMQAKHPLAFKHAETGPLANSMLGAFASGSPQQQPAAAPKRKVSADELSQYATTHKMTPEAAKTYLSDQGYQVGE